MNRTAGIGLTAILCGSMAGSAGAQSVPTRPPDADKALRNSIGMVFVPVPAGEFLMGSPEKQESNLNLFGPGVVWWKLIEGPQHKVRLTRPFYLGATEVTQNQWKAVMGNNPSLIQGDGNLPMDQVGWDDCRVFLKRLSEKEGRAYRLPTEAEWEYACRAGSTTTYCYGDANEQLDEYAWHAKVSPREFKTHPVGLKKPNAWGLHDMHGNVWEWCHDRFAGSKAPYEAEPQIDPTGAVKDWGDRVMRGGARFYNKPTTCSSTCRNAYEGDYRMGEVGFRVAISALEVARPAPPTQPGETKPPLAWDQRVSAPEEKARLERLGAICNGVGMVMMPVPAGEFTMGGNDTKYEQPTHKVKITRAFHIGATEVTQAQWKAVTGDNPSFIKGDDLPVENVSWDECQAFVKKLSEKEGKAYRLPTEAEWEYACRAGSAKRFPFGDDANLLGDYAWFDTNSDVRTHPVASRKPNAWGLYDVLGNVWEWCQDPYAAYEDKEQTDPAGPAKPGQRVLRGGAWYCLAGLCRSAGRNSRGQIYRYYFGLRVVLAP